MPTTNYNYYRPEWVESKQVSSYPINKKRKSTVDRYKHKTTPYTGQFPWGTLQTVFIHPMFEHGYETPDEKRQKYIGDLIFLKFMCYLCLLDIIIGYGVFVPLFIMLMG